LQQVKPVTFFKVKVFKDTQRMCFPFCSEHTGSQWKLRCHWMEWKYYEQTLKLALRRCGHWNQSLMEVVVRPIGKCLCHLRTYNCSEFESTFKTCFRVCTFRNKFILASGRSSTFSCAYMDCVVTIQDVSNIGQREADYYLCNVIAVVVSYITCILV